MALHLYSLPPKVGDKLMGPNGTPRNVLSLTRGIGPMFRVTPKVGGVPFVCNDVHVLSLMELWTEKDGASGGGAIVDIPLDQYLAKSRNWKRRHGLFRAKLDFGPKDLPVDPYVLGLWLGDGSSKGAHLTSVDVELIDIWNNWIASNGDLTRIAGDITYCAARQDDADRLGSVSFQKLKSVGVIDNKHIPHLYLTSSREQRLRLLAGLLDSDGYCGDRNFEITQKNERLAKNIAYLARSLGFKVSEKSIQKSDQNGIVGTYQRATIFGKLSEIPTILARKRGVDGKKNPLTTLFSVEPIGSDDYYGFTIDGDSRFVLGDFTVTHNTTCKISIIAANLWAGRSIIFITHEGRKLDVMEKIWCCMLNLTKGEFRALSFSDDPAHLALLKQVASIINQNLLYIDYQKPGSTAEEVISMTRQHQQRRKAKYGKGYDMFANDYPAILGAEGLKNLKTERRHKDAYVYRYFVDYAGDQSMHGLYSIQTNRKGSEKNKRTGDYANKTQLVQLEDVQEAYEVTNSATNLLTINRSPDDQGRNIITYLFCKSRSSETNIAVTCRSDFRRSRTHWANLPATWYRGTSQLDQMENLLSEYANREVPTNYKDLQNHGKD